MCKTAKQVFRHPTRNDMDALIEIYKQNRDTLGIPFSRVFDEIMRLPHFYVIVEDNNKVIAFGGIKEKPRCKEYEIIHLCVAEGYRRQHIGIDFCMYLLQQVKSTDTLLGGYLFKYPIYAYAVKDKPNNKFYDCISKGSEIVEKKTTTLIKYEIDYEKIKEKLKNG